jgi:hypothetical protein
MKPLGGRAAGVNKNTPKNINQHAQYPFDSPWRKKIGVENCGGE